MTLQIHPRDVGRRRDLIKEGPKTALIMKGKRDPRTCSTQGEREKVVLTGREEDQYLKLQLEDFSESRGDTKLVNGIDV